MKEKIKCVIIAVLKAALVAALTTLGINTTGCVAVDLDDGNPHNINWNTLLKRGKRHDYFTSALPWPQRGEAVQIPLGSRADVYGTGQPMFVGEVSAYNQPHSINLHNGTKDFDLATNASVTGKASFATKGELGSNLPYLYADLSTATAATINSLRMAFQLQRLLETDARATGSRICEIIRAHFSTICPDARLQRSEYLGGSSQQIAFSTVTQTSGTTDDTPQGNLTANGKCVSHSGFTKSFSEWGYIIGLASENPPLKRVIAVQDEPELILDAYLGQTWTRPLGCYSIPGLIDHL
ncbi:unnamed protein product [Cylicocyclus nassatus]|uniref:Uncharacterized protein n=1 Tax=Cylicocyclus nassatus TaxID=53992 RepID=A0AA36GQI3_CYLNA|nr:unnamed protein product [Cylicocyclus nassatus]CAJ0596476.1 unnamed protein product [Cylicocyclus nassatus]CAJ0596477.1 unnamed protein product [Cylicocyclus nassatus]CAJ0596478.1 unnamed protein product [Cylicocyclus nassatus]